MSLRIAPASGKSLLLAAWLLVIVLLPVAPLSAHGGGKQQIAGELMMQSEQHPLTRETADEELADILQKLRLQSLDLRFQQLQQLAAQGKLDSDQSRQYLELLSLKQKLKTGQKHDQ